jgi:crotonobetainyl-CoA:carnitine CoA-transferase CaiB-like acyl-CoA transferase
MPDGPLSGTVLGIPAVGAAAAHARWLAADLGADVHPDRDDLSFAGCRDALEWARSGAMSLTSSTGGAPQLVEGSPASLVRAALAVLGQLTGAVGLPGVQLLGERAACRGGKPVGSAFRSLRTTDAWIGLSLARPSDIELVAALVGAEPVTDLDLERWAAERGAAEVLERALLLGLPASRIGAATGASRPPVLLHRGARRTSSATPLVIDLSALWAGPLCTHLLGLTGARIVKVESLDRPDGARTGPSQFYDLLHAGHESVALDLRTATGRGQLSSLCRQADLVVDSSRPRAMAQLGITPEEFVADGTSWLAITAYGRDPEAAMRVGFGDDVAADAGLVWWDGPTPRPVGDAIADPLTGVVAGVAAAAALASPSAWFLDVSMASVAWQARSISEGAPAAHVQATSDGWEVRVDREHVPVALPHARPAGQPAPALGADTDRIRRELRA